jgi:hypothetical protein
VRFTPPEIIVAFWFCLAMAGCRPAVTAPAPSDSSAAGAVPSGLLFTWDGEVDGRDILIFREGRCTLEHERNLPIRHMRFHSYHPLEAASFPVILVKQQGRGEVRIIRQGDDLNGFTLLVRVDDLHFGGAGRYRFSAYRAGSAVSGEPVFYLYAEVEDAVEYEIDIGRAQVRQLNESSAGKFKYFFRDEQPIPMNRNFDLRMIRGRGTVTLTALPPDRTGVRLRIEDQPAGSAVYELALVPR